MRRRHTTGMCHNVAFCFTSSIICCTSTPIIFSIFKVTNSTPDSTAALHLSP